jgi:hypothetical protein
LTRYTETAVDPPEDRIGVEFRVEGEFDLLPGKPAELGELRKILEDFFGAEGMADAEGGAAEASVADPALHPATAEPGESGKAGDA